MISAISKLEFHIVRSVIMQWPIGTISLAPWHFWYSVSCLSIVTWLSLSVVVIKHADQNQLSGWEGLFQLSGCRPLCGGEVRPGSQAGSWSRSQAGTLLAGLLTVSFLIQPLPGNGAAHHGQGPPPSTTTKKVFQRHAYRAALSETLFSDDFELCQVDS